VPPSRFLPRKDGAERGQHRRQANCQLHTTHEFRRQQSRAATPSTLRTHEQRASLQTGLRPAPLCHPVTSGRCHILVFGWRPWRLASLQFPETRGKYLADRFDVWFPKHLAVIELNFVNLDSAFGSCSPSHLRIFYVVERLLRPLEEYDGSAELRRGEVLWPVGFSPIATHAGCPVLHYVARVIL